jgi:DNA-binding transcriptional ArsR family regulator
VPVLKINSGRIGYEIVTPAQAAICRDIFAESSLWFTMAAMAMSSKRIEDVATLRALAHPLRIRMLAALRTDGPATATQLARRFDETSGATSYHLRQLERYGFVEEDAEQPSRRERRWQAAQELTQWDTADFLDDAAGRSALRVFERERIDLLVRLLQRWYAERADWPREWVSATVDTDVLLRLRPADLAAFRDDFRGLVQRYDAGQRDSTDDTARRVFVIAQAFPTEEIEL